MYVDGYQEGDTRMHHPKDHNHHGHRSPNAVKFTRSGRPRVPPLDTIALSQQAKAHVESVLSGALDYPSMETKAALRTHADIPPGDHDRAAAWVAVERARTEDLLTAAAHLEFQADSILIQKEGYMYRLAMSLQLFEGCRGVFRAMGMDREALSKRTTTALDGEARPPVWSEAEGAALAGRHLIRRYDNAATELPKVAAEVALARYIKIRVRPHRNDLIKELAAMGATRVYIAGIIGRELPRQGD